MSRVRRPPNCDGFTIGIICALDIESDAVRAVFDEDWEKDQEYSGLRGDNNEYSMGRIGEHNVVLAYMPGMGTTDSVHVAVDFQRSFRNIELGLIVGICGAAPFIRENFRTSQKRDKEVILGDIIMSTEVMTLDFGWQHPHELQMKDTIRDRHGRPDPRIRAFLHRMRDRQGRKDLQSRTYNHLNNLLQQDGFEESGYPGAHNDVLYKSTYRHKHRGETTCVCAQCTNATDAVCHDALQQSCKELGCDLGPDSEEKIQRKRLPKLEKNSPARADHLVPPRPLIKFGIFSSTNFIIMSSSHHDKLI